VEYEEFSEDPDMEPPEIYYTSLEAIICNPLIKKLTYLNLMTKEKRPNS
jgi:hypothetical protein